MEILSNNIVNSLSFEKRNRHVNPFFIQLDKLEIGEGLRVSKDEWTLKSRIQVAIANHGRRVGKKFRAMVVTGTEGWVVIRSE